MTIFDLNVRQLEELKEDLKAQRELDDGKDHSLDEITVQELIESYQDTEFTPDDFMMPSRYKVVFTVWAYVDAKDEDEAIDKAQESLQIKIKCDSCLLDYVETTDEA